MLCLLFALILCYARPSHYISQGGCDHAPSPYCIMHITSFQSTQTHVEDRKDTVGDSEIGR